MEKFLKELGFNNDQGENQWELENRDCSVDDQEDYKGHEEINDDYNEYFCPIADKIKAKARELGAKISMDAEYQYGILTVEVIK